MKQKTLESIAAAGTALVYSSYAAGSSVTAGAGGCLADMEDKRTHPCKKIGVLAFIGVPPCLLAGYVLGKIAALAG